tara:strand:- start:198 stop:656 length:459 start_codon:yes stop_codon:yes gene_type:complete
MSLQTTIKEKLVEAMRAKDTTRLSVLRGLSSSFTNELVATGKTPQETLSDEEVLAVIKREANKRKDSIEQFTKGGRPELAESEKIELTILEEFLPEMMSKEEIEKIVIQKKEELEISDTSKMGILIGAVMKETKGNADGSMVKEIVEEKLAE